MIEDVSKLVLFCEKHHITFDQYMLCHILYLDKLEHSVKRKSVEEHIPITANIYRYAQNVRGWTAEEVRDLVEKGLLVDYNTGIRNDGSKEMYPDFYEVTDKFVSAIHATTTEFDQFWDAYPSFIPSFNGLGGKITLKAVDKDAMEVLYKRKVSTKNLHLRVMKAVEFGKHNKLISTNIAKFIEGEIWKGIEEEMKNSYQGIGMPGVTSINK